MKIMTIKLLFALLFISSVSYGQKDIRISSVSFVEILNDNRAEALFYFQNNWKVLRDMAISKKHIESYQFMEVPTTDENSFDLILITTYENKEQYELREKNFKELIDKKGERKLMNDKKPEEFRKTLFTRVTLNHWN